MLASVGGVASGEGEQGVVDKCQARGQVGLQERQEGMHLVLIQIAQHAFQNNNLVDIIISEEQKGIGIVVVIKSGEIFLVYGIFPSLQRQDRTEQNRQIDR